MTRLGDRATHNPVGDIVYPDTSTFPGSTRTSCSKVKVNAVATEWTQESANVLIGQYRLRSTLHGTDGPSLDLVLSGEVTTNANGVVTVYGCE